MILKQSILIFIIIIIPHGLSTELDLYVYLDNNQIPLNLPFTIDITIHKVENIYTEDFNLVHNPEIHKIYFARTGY